MSKVNYLTSFLLASFIVIGLDSSYGFCTTSSRFELPASPDSSTPLLNSALRRRTRQEGRPAQNSMLEGEVSRDESRGDGLFPSLLSPLGVISPMRGTEAGLKSLEDPLLGLGPIPLL